MSAGHSKGAWLSILLTAEPRPVQAEGAKAFWEAARGRLARLSRPVDRAIVAGFLSDRVGYAFLAGYRSALQVLVPALAAGELATFSVTEAGGNHPRAIATRLTRTPDGTALVSGKKRFATLGPLASSLIVVASEGKDEDGKNQLRAVWVDRGARGVTVRPMPELPFVPEVPHAEIELDRVSVEAERILSGDGYSDYVKPFRTLEDVFVHAALLGYVFGAGRRTGAPGALLERVVALLACARALSELDPRASETHVAVAGLIAQSRDLLDSDRLAAFRLEPDEQARFDRDRPLVSVASEVREKRRRRAWKTLTGGLEEGS